MEFKELINEEGNRYHRLKVLKRVPPPGNSHQAHWLCECDCGNYTVAPGGDLRRGKNKSCGCHAIKQVSKFANVDKEYPQHHWKRNHPGYGLWCSMIKSCYSETHHRYGCNGAIGRRVCFEWLNNAASFLIWLDNKEYKKGYSVYIDEKDKEYSPNNCLLISRSEAISKRKMQRDKIDHKKYIGKEIGFLKIIGKEVKQKIYSYRKTPINKIKWICECKCGNRCLKDTADLNSGRKLSCGCRNRVCEWSVDYMECINCKKTSSPYCGNGLCRRCYNGLKKDPNYMPNDRLDIKNRWSVNFDKCLCCGTNEIKHHTHGYCVVCRQKKEVKNKFTGKS